MAEKDEDRDDKDDAAEGGDEGEKQAEASESSEKAEGGAKPKRAKAARGPGGSRGRAPARQGSSLGKSMILFLVIILGIGGGIALLGKEDGQPAPAKPKWKVGETVDVELTLVKTDKNDLACASTEQVAGKHCAFEAQGKPWKGDNTDDKAVLKPYTTTDRIELTAAGLWSEPALADKLPNTRFSVKCKYKVEGTLKELGIHWRSEDPFGARKEWFAGTVSGCQLGK